MPHPPFLGGWTGDVAPGRRCRVAGRPPTLIGDFFVGFDTQLGGAGAVPLARGGAFTRLCIFTKPPWPS